MFDPNLSRDIDKVRVLVGDTDSNNEKLSDDTISAVLAFSGNYVRAAAHCAQMIAAKYADKTDVRGMHVQSSRSLLYKHYMNLAQKLFAQAASADSFYKARWDVRPVFSRGIHDNDS